MNVTNTILAIGVPSIIGAFIYVGKKLQVLEDLKISVDKMKHNLSVVCNFLIKNSDDFSSSELKTLSPLQLTQEGNDLIKNIGFDKVFSEHRKDFFAFIDDEQPKLKYDVEIAAIKSIYFLYDKDFMQFLKIFFYNKPERNFENTAPTLGVYIRDAYLAEHPEIIQ